RPCRRAGRERRRRVLVHDAPHRADRPQLTAIAASYQGTNRPTVRRTAPRTAGRFPCPLGALTSNTSSAAHASATEVIFAPDLLYAASSRVALSPASDSTSSSYPRPIGRLTVAGVAATREGRRAAIPSATPIRVGYFSLQYRRLSARPRS